MPTTQAAPTLVQSFRDSNGNPLAGGQLYTYVAGTSTPQSTYIDATGTTTNANPVVLNSRGEAPVWLTIGQSYKFVLYDAFSTMIYSVDQIAATNPIGTPIALTATGITGAAASGANADITSLTGPVSTVNGQPLLHLNDVVNGNFAIAQAGASFAPAASNTYDLDGWINGNGTTAVFTVAQVAGSTAGRFARQITITTAAATVAAGSYVSDETRIEGYNVEKYVGKTFTVGFRAIVPVAGIHCVSLRNTGTDRSYIVEINFPTANVWQTCSFTVVGGLPTAGTWNYTNGIGLDISFSHMAGTTFTTTPNAWQTGNFLATINQVNDCATVNNVWALEKVTLNLGTVAAVSESSIAQEIVIDQRQFEKSFSDGVTPGTATLAGAHQSIAATVFILQSGAVRFASSKRATPTVTVYSTQTGASNVGAEFDASGTFVIDRALTVVMAGTSGFSIGGGGTMTVGNNIRFGWTAASRL